MTRNKEIPLGDRRIAHFRKRLMERFGLTIDNTGIEVIIDDIFQGANQPILILEDNGNSFHFVEVGETTIIILFDWETLVPLTVYHVSWLKLNDDGDHYLHYGKRAKDIRILNRATTFSQKTGITNHQICSSN